METQEDQEDGLQAKTTVQSLKIFLRIHHRWGVEQHLKHILNSYFALHSGGWGLVLFYSLQFSVLIFNTEHV